VPIKTHSVFDPAFIFQAIGESFKKLNPLTLTRNPMIFVTQIGAAISTILLATVRDSNFGFQFQITLWIWLKPKTTTA
jgi:K+-transporting ATPase ATPase B chain